MTQEIANRRLFKAAKSGNVNAGEQALDAGADVNAKDPFQKTPLHYATYIGHVAVARLLIKNGADIDAHDHIHQSPLRLAHANNQSELVRLLQIAAKHQLGQ